MKAKEKMMEYLTGKRGMRIILVLACLGVALIVGSEYLGDSEPPAPKKQGEQPYAQMLEARIAAVVSAITGESSPQVMVTLESSGKHIYATESKEKSRSTGDSADETESEEKFILVKKSDGTQEALQITEMEPAVRGIVIVSSAAASASSRESIVNAACTVLNLPSNKVCVVSKSN